MTAAGGWWLAGPHSTHSRAEAAVLQLISVKKYSAVDQSAHTSAFPGHDGAIGLPERVCDPII